MPGGSRKRLQIERHAEQVTRVFEFRVGNARNGICKPDYAVEAN